MQGFTIPPRELFTEDQIRALLVSDSLTVSAGCELLSKYNVLLGDISDDLVGGEVNRDCYADVHGTCRLQLTRTMTWGADRVRPYMILSNDDISARFNLGVYVLTSPIMQRAEDPATFEVDGYDLLYLLSTTGPGDTYVVYKGVSYLTAVQDIINKLGIWSFVRMDGNLQNQPLPNSMVWAITSDGSVTWLNIINDLLASISYRGLWVNQDGDFRSGPYTPPSERPIEWTFDTSDVTTNIVGEERTMSAEAWGLPNWWRFIRSNTETQPVEGNGMVTMTNQSDGATSIDVIGHEVRKVVYLEAADHATLAAQGAQIVSDDRRFLRTFELQVDPLPVAGHFDVVQLIDGGAADKCQVQAWTIPLDGSPGQWVLGLAT